MRLSSSLSFALATALIVVACGDEEPVDDDGSSSSSSGTGGTINDGKLRPPGNGTMISEDQACAQMQSAFEARQMALGCSLTVQLCPGFVRGLQLDAMCRAYDEGSVQGCVAYYNGAAACPDLDPKHCVPTIFPETDTCM